MSSLKSSGRLTLLAISSLTIMVGAAIAPALSSISEAYGIADMASWLITLPSLGAVIFAPLAGRLIDKMGAYRALNLGLFGYAVLGLGALLLTSPMTVFADRFLLGGATALVMAGGTTLISQWYQGRERLKMMALQGMSIELGGVIFLFLSGQLALMDWRYPFGIYALGWLFWLMLWLFVPRESPAAKAKEVNDDHSSMAHSLKRIYLAALAAMVIFFTLIVTLPLTLKSDGYSEDQIGYFLAFISVVAVAVASQMPRVVRSLGERNTLIGSFVIYACAHTLFFFSSGEAWLLSLAAILAGTGFGLSIPLVNHMTVESSHPQVRGRNLAYLTMAIFLGQFLTSLLDFVPLPRQDLFALVAILSLASAVLFTLDYQWRRHRGRLI